MSNTAAFQPPAPQLDQISISRLQLLHPLVRAEALALYGRACRALTGRATVRIVQGYRTFAEQHALFLQRPKVTNADQGQSYHNYGLALDFALLVDGKTISWETGKDFDGDKVADWMEVVQIFKSAGWTWGGDFKSLKDMPHFEKTFNLHWSKMLSIYKSKDGRDAAGYIKIAR